MVTFQDNSKPKMRYTPFAWLTLSAFFFLSGCKTGNQLRLDHTNFTEEISPEQNLSFTFASDLVPDSLTQKWDSTEYIKISPAVRGKFKWNSSRELIFSPSEPFPQSTDFTAELTANLFNHAPVKLDLPKDKSVKFHTPYLLMSTVQMFWATSQKNPGAVEVRMNIVFNCTVKPADLQKKLHVFVNEKETSFDVLGTTADYSIGIAIADVRGISKDALPLRVTIDPGLTCAGSTYQTKEKMEFEGEIPTKEKIMIVQMTAGFVDGQGVISVYANQPVVNENINSLVKINPLVSITTEKIDNGFLLKGDFEADKTYEVVLSKELKGIFGFTLDEDYSQNVSFGELEPSISFADTKGMYLTSRGARKIGINISSINKLKVSVIRIYENNILSFMRSRQDWGYYYDESEDNENYYSHHYRYYNYYNYGDVISEKSYKVSSLPKQGNLRLLTFNLDDMGYSDRFKGMYLIKVEDEDRQWLQESRFVSLSDIGLIARQSEDEVYVFTNSILTTEALSAVKVNFISTNNQLVGSETTYNRGVAILKNAKSTAGDFRIGMITCTQGDDFNFMLLDRSGVETSRYEVGGKYSNDAHLDAFIYGDREIYRPGDSVHTNTIVRTDEWHVVTDVPMKMKLILPSGKEYASWKKTPDTQGSFETSFYLPVSIITGVYTLELFAANDVYIAGKQFSVEEFVPDRIKVASVTNAASYKPREELRAEITANNLFGPPAANRNYEIELQLNRSYFQVKKFNSYDFNIETPDQISLQNVMRTGKTDEQGKVIEKFTLPAHTDIGVLDGSIYTTIFDETGRPVHQISKFTVNTQDVFYGIKYFDSWISTRQPLKIDFIACNTSGQAVNAKATVEIYKWEWQNVLTQAGGRYRYESQRREVMVSKKEIIISTGGGSLSFTPYNSGSYEVRISRPGANTYVSMSFWAYGWHDTNNTSFEVSNEGEITLEPDKENYSVGDEAKVLLKSPFEGKVLVTVERNRIFDYYYLDTKDKAASLTIPIKDEHLPNLYVTATAIRKLSGNQIPLTVARGYMPLKVSKSETKLSVAISAAESSRSKSKQHITVKTVPNAELTITVVDEGILQLKNTKTPDPYNFFYQQRALEVHSFDLYPMLFPEYSSNATSAIGGDMAEMAKRTNPFTVKRFKLVSLWSGILKADGSGNASFDINVPQFSGALRVMAVAYKENSFGSAEKTMRVADPIVISSALPRFLSPSDTVKVPVTLTNTTEKTAEATAEISVTGSVTLSSAKTQTLSISPNSEAQVEFSVLAKNALGAGTITINVNALGEKFSDQTEIAVRPASPLVKITGSGTVSAGKSESVSLKGNMYPGTMNAKLVISKSPMAEFSKDLRYLIQYPYGCVEQTTSAAFPQLYYRDLAKVLGQEGKATVYNPDYNVQQAIKKLESMQLYNGSISYWPGGDYESWWSTAYAAHFLTEARKAGFEVNEKILEKIYSYLQQKIKGRTTETWYYWDANGIARSKMVWNRETIYSMFVLAISGRFDQPAMNYYKANTEMLTPDSRYMLAAVYYLSGSQKSFKELLPDSWSKEVSKRAFGGSFYSGIRDEAIALYVLQEADPSNPQIGIMSQHLSQKLKKERWLSTQEAAFSFLALGKIARRSAASNITATVSVNGKPMGNFSGKDITISKDMANQSVTIQASGTGMLYYFWEIEGIDVSGKVKEEDSYMRVRKTFYNRYGQKIIPTSINQNDLIVVKLSVQTIDYNASVENVAVTDLLPAGFEIENPRISSIPDLDWIKDPAYYDHMDIRDDRIIFFCTATPATKNFYYVVRAVSKGLYHMGPVSADAMYNAEYHSYWGAGKLIVK